MPRRTRLLIAMSAGLAFASLPRTAAAGSYVFEGIPATHVFQVRLDLVPGMYRFRTSDLTPRGSDTVMHLWGPLECTTDRCAPGTTVPPSEILFNDDANPDQETSRRRSNSPIRRATRICSSSTRIRWRRQARARSASRGHPGRASSRRASNSAETRSGSLAPRQS